MPCRSPTPNTQHPPFTTTHMCTPDAQEIKLEVFGVAVRDAAAPGPKGLLHHMLARWQSGAVSSAVFGLPAVQVGR